MFFRLATGPAFTNLATLWLEAGAISASDLSGAGAGSDIALSLKLSLIKLRRTMLRTALVFVIFVAAAGTAQDTNGVINMLYRILPHAAASSFVVSLSGSPNSTESFELYDTTKDGQPAIAVQGNTLSAISMGIGWYLRRVANCSVDWTGTQIAISVPLPPVGSAQPIFVKAKVPLRYYFNEEVHGYSTTFWSWDQWQYHIDWWEGQPETLRQPSA
jgi:alpha-N-acetylglucosaminidase